MRAPEHLLPFLDGTPLAIYRIEVAWPNLTQSDKISLLSLLFKDDYQNVFRLQWNVQRKKLEALALGDPDPYVRYLIGKRITKPYLNPESGEDDYYKQELAKFQKVSSDPEQLVRVGGIERGWKVINKEIEDPESFWLRPHLERLAIVNGIKEDGEKIAVLIEVGLNKNKEKGTPSEDEVFEVLLQYLGDQTIEQRVRESEDYAHKYYDGWAEYSAGKSAEALWLLVPKVPPNFAYALIWSLPEEAGFSSGIPKEVIGSLNNHLLAELLSKRTVKLKELRREIYDRPSDTDDAYDPLKACAINSPWFELTNSDVSKIVYDLDEQEESGKKKYKALAFVAENIQNADLAQLQALRAYISDAPSKFTGWGNYEAIGVLDDKRLARAKSLDKQTLLYEVQNARTFELAIKLAPIKEGVEPAEPEHKLFLGAIVPKNPWQTYINLLDLRKDRKWGWKNTRLPDIWIPDFNIPDNLIDDENSREQQEFDLAFTAKQYESNLSLEELAQLKALSEAFNELSEKIDKRKLATEIFINNSFRSLREQISIIKYLAIGIGLFLIYFVLKIST
jgi:hypothetical protein